MSNSQQLFDLIKSLSKNEKRNFRLYAQLHSKKGTSSYLQLFDLLDKMKNYDESSIKELLTKKQKAAQFNPMVNYLFDVIVNSLSIYNNKNFIAFKLKKKVNNAFILRKKGLYKKSKKLLISAKKEAFKIEDFTTLLEIYKLLIIDVPDIERFKILEEMGLVIKKIENIHSYNKILTEMSSLFGKLHKARNPKDLKAIKELLSSPLLNDENLALSNNAKELFHNIKSFYYFFSGDHQQALHHQKRTKNCFESSPEFLKLNFNGYLQSINNITTIYSRLNLHEKTKEMVGNLLLILNDKNITDIPLKSKIFEIHASKTTDLAIKTGDYKNIHSFIPEIEKGLIKYKSNITPENFIIIYTNISIIYFNLEEYKKALAWLNKSERYQKQMKRIDALTFIRLLNMLIHYEIGNKELVTYMERSSRRYIKNQNQLFKTESILLHFFRVTVIKIETQEDTLFAFKQLKAELNEVFKDPFESKLLEYFDFISWVNSKIQSRPFAEVLREKINSK